MERGEEGRKVNSIARLDSRPVLSALSRAVGTPAFSISQLLFVFVEGEEGVGERERFRKLAGLPQNVRFMECGSCNEVLRRVTTIKALAHEAEAKSDRRGCRSGISRRYRCGRAVWDHAVFALPVHEVENFFLHPVTFRQLLEQNGRAELVPLDLIRTASDARAGSWIFQYEMATPNAKSLPDISVQAKERAKVLTWAQIDADRHAAILRIVESSGFGPEDKQKFQGILEVAATAYARKRAEDGIWKTCEGKQVLNAVAVAAGSAGAPVMIEAALAAWGRQGAVIPDELLEFRTYLAAL